MLTSSATLCGREGGRDVVGVITVDLLGAREAGTYSADPQEEQNLQHLVHSVSIHHSLAIYMYPPRGKSSRGSHHIISTRGSSNHRRVERRSEVFSVGDLWPTSVGTSGNINMEATSRYLYTEEAVAARVGAPAVSWLLPGSYANHYYWQRRKIKMEITP